MSNSKKLRNTFYALTDRRAIVITGGATRSLKAYDLSRIVSTDKQSKPDNTGSVLFYLGSDALPMMMNRYGNANTVGFMPPGFLGIADVDSVHRLIEGARVKQ